MKRNSAVHKKLKEILSQKSFEELEPFKNTSEWTALHPDDKSLLASLFVMQGEKQLEQGDKNAKESFDLAAKLAGDSGEVFLEIGSAYAKNQLNVQCLRYAAEYLSKSIQLTPPVFSTWALLGRVHNSMGMLIDETCHFEEADKYYQQAFQLSHDQPDSSKAMLNWQWAVSWYCMGKHSGEALDFNRAVEKFREAERLGMQDKYFWSNYGDSLAELASLLGRPDLFYEVIELYRNAIRLSFDFFEGWLSMGCAFQRLFEIFGSEEDYNQSYECFKLASQLNESHPMLWSKWAQLTAQGGKWKRDLILIGESLEKFEKAHFLDPENPVLLCLWGETLLVYGAHGEKVDALRQAENKIVKSLSIQHDVADAWYMYGCCLNELGRYFHQEDYYHKAIEKFQYGLGLKQNEPLLWYGLALSHLAIGESRGELAWLEQACRLFSRALEFGGQNVRPLWNDWGVTLMKISELTGDKAPVEAAIDKFETLIPAMAEEWDEADLDPEWLYNYGCALDFMGDFTDEISFYEKAVQALSKAVQMDPEYTHARYNLALALSHLGETALDVECYHKSVEQFQILLNQDGEDEMGWIDYGVTLIQLARLIFDPARPDVAYKIYEVAEGKLMQAAALGAVQAYYNLACLHSLMGNFPMAMHFVEKAEAAQVLPPPDELLADEWLEDLRETESFKFFFAHYKKDKKIIE